MKPSAVASQGLTFDAGMLVALDRGDRAQWARLERAIKQGVCPTVPAPVVAQVWRSPRQVRLARALKICKVESTDLSLSVEAGRLLAKTGTADAVDAIVVASAARRGDAIVTSDGVDVSRLAVFVKGVTVLRS